MSDQGLGTTSISQIAVVVRDIERAARTYADVFHLPVPKIIITEKEEVTHAKYRGAPTQARAKLAFFQMGSLSLELIEPVGGPSTWQEFLEKHGEGVHHIAFRIKGMEEVLTFLAGKGMPAVQRGDFKGGRYAYVDSEPALGVILELLESLPT
jgi:catechol 2,3-dioxygenase-like lactoylglutathione lyase family enzyme